MWKTTLGTNSRPSALNATLERSHHSRSFARRRSAIVPARKQTWPTYLGFKVQLSILTSMTVNDHDVDDDADGDDEDEDEDAEDDDADDDDDDEKTMMMMKLMGEDESAYTADSR